MIIKDNLEFYNTLRTVPEEAKKEITAGSLAGFTDINPMWRIKALTQLFGPYGMGWKVEILNKWLQAGSGAKDVKAFVDINLYYKYNGEWSEAIPGTGGSSFISSKNGEAASNDDCFKMALTDAIGVASKMLGVGADVYFEKDATKYSAKLPEPTWEPQISTATEGEIQEPELTIPVGTASDTIPVIEGLPKMEAVPMPQPTERKPRKRVSEPATNSVNTAEIGTNQTAEEEFERKYRPRTPPKTRDEALMFPLSIGEGYRDNPDVLANVLAKKRGVVEYYSNFNPNPQLEYQAALKIAAKMVLQTA